MMYYLFKRLCNIPLTLFCVSILTFLLIRLVPVEPAEVMLRMAHTAPTEESLDAMRTRLGTDQPLIIQYVTWIRGVIQLDFGTSFVSKQAVATDLFAKLPATALLACVSFLLTVLISIPLGVMNVLTKSRLLKIVGQFFALCCVSVPVFWLGFLFIYVGSLKWGLFPSHGMGTWQHLFLPALTLAIPTIGLFSQLIQQTIVELQQTSFMHYARVRGVKNRTLIKYYAQHLLLRLLPLLVVTFGSLIGGAIVVEQVFSWPGLGRYLIESVINRDYPVIQAYVMMIACCYCVLTLLGDIAQQALDPRLRLKEVSR